MKKFLIIAAVFCFCASLFAKYISFVSAKETDKLELEAKRYNGLKADWGSDNNSKAKLLSLSDDLGTKYFSANISQKQISDKLFSISFLVLNSDEFDSIMQRIIDGNYQIKKLEITYNGAAYLIIFEALI